MGRSGVKVKRNVFAVLGWVVWKLLALLGVRYAKDRLRDDRRRG